MEHGTELARTPLSVSESGADPAPLRTASKFKIRPAASQLPLRRRLEQSHPERVCLPCCPVVTQVPHPGTPGFLVLLRAAAAGYVHTTVAGASADDIAELRWLLIANDDDLEAYRPWGPVETEDAPPSNLLEPALAILTLRRPAPPGRARRARWSPSRIASDAPAISGSSYAGAPCI